eukprot:2423681-Amphidinium_carterae.1
MAVFQIFRINTYTALDLELLLKDPNHMLFQVEFLKVLLCSVGTTSCTVGVAAVQRSASL